MVRSGLIIVLICISLITNDVELLSMYLLATYIFSLVGYLLSFFGIFLIKLFIFLLLSFKSSLCILDSSTSLQVSFINVFSHIHFILKEKFQQRSALILNHLF